MPVQFALNEDDEERCRVIMSDEKTENRPERDKCPCKEKKKEQKKKCLRTITIQ